MASRFIDKEYGVDTSTALADDTTGKRKVRNLLDAAGLVYDKVDNFFKYNGNDAVKVLVDSTSAQTLTNKTLTAPVITAPTLSGAGTLADLIFSDHKVLAASITYDTTTVLATITGFSWTVVAGATYAFDMELGTTQTTVGGLSVAFKLTTATLTSIRYNTYQATAVDNTTAVSATGTTTTDQTKMVDNKTAAYTRTRVFGSFVVNAGGTFAFQAAQNTGAGAGDVTIILLGSQANLKRVA